MVWKPILTEEEQQKLRGTVDKRRLGAMVSAIEIYGVVAADVELARSDKGQTATDVMIMFTNLTGETVHLTLTVDDEKLHKVLEDLTQRRWQSGHRD